jgi:hypothetical protein
VAPLPPSDSHIMSLSARQSAGPKFLRKPSSLGIDFGFDDCVVLFGSFLQRKRFPSMTAEETAARGADVERIPCERRLRSLEEAR